MKPFIPYSLLAAAAACGIALGQAYTTPVGYETVEIPNTIEFNLIGLRLHSPLTLTSSISAVNGTVVSINNADFDDILSSGTTYILEINNGDGEGILQEVDSWGTSSGNLAGDLVVQVDLSDFDVVAGDTVSLRAAPTIEEIFGSSNLQTGFVASQADVVWIPDGTGNFTRYYKSALVGNPWKDAATNADTPNVPIIYPDGILVQKRAASSPTSLVVTGEVKVTPTLTALADGTSTSPSFNVISTVYPVGLTLQNSGIKDDLAPGFVSSQADVVWVPDSIGGFNRYYVSSLVGNPWKDAATNADVLTPVELSSGILIERKAAATNIKIMPPDSWDL
jgi:hypothetical protein